MFEDIKSIEDHYERKMGFKPLDKPYDKPSLTGLIISALYSIARNVRELRAEVEALKVKTYGSTD